MVCDVGGERTHHHEGGGGRNRRNPIETSALGTLWKCGDLLCPISGKGLLAGQSGARVSASRAWDQRLRGGVVGRRNHRGHDSGRDLPAAASSVCGVVLVSGNAGADDRTGADWGSRYGRPLRLYPAAGDFRNRLLGCGGSDESLACSNGGDSGRHCGHPADTGSCAASAGGFLERQCHPVGAHGGDHRKKLHCRR